MKIKTEFPFEDFIGYLVTNKEDRKNVCLVKKTNNKERTTISYARYLMSVKEKRILEKDEQVDHKDENKKNDFIDNLQILSKKENNLKNRIHRNITRKYVLLKCPSCNNEFEKEKSQTHLSKKGKYTSCSRKCSYELLKKGLSVSELQELGKNQIIKEFNK